MRCLLSLKVQDSSHIIFIIILFQEVARVMGIVTSVNHTLSHDIARLRVLMKSLLTEVKKHVVSKIIL